MTSSTKKAILPRHNAVWQWWLTMVIIAAVNLMAACYGVHRTGASLASLLALVYVGMCAFRSALPRADLKRLCLFETPLSTPLVGRSVATVGELCFVVLLAMCLVRAAECVGRTAGGAPMPLPTFRAAAGVSVGLVVVAEALSWMGCLTQCELWSAAEETLWTVSALVLLCGLAACYGGLAAAGDAPAATGLRHLLVVGLVVGVAYVAFMTVVDVPMYISMWRSKTAAERSRSCSGWGARVQCMDRCAIVSDRLVDWRREIPWQTGYFVFAAWAAIGLALWYSSA